MKNFAKLTLFFSSYFILFFFAAILLGFIDSWIDLARIIPVDARPGEEIAAVVWKALPAAIYLSILISVSYSVRRKMPIFFAIFCTIILAFIFATGVSLGIGRVEALKTAFKPIFPIEAQPGLIISQNENSIILLRESGDVRGSRLVSIPGRPFIYQEVPLGPNNTILSLPAISLGDDTPWFVRSIGIDFSLSAEELKSRFERNYLSFAAYAFSLILLLSSLRFLMELSQWPLANVFLGALVFRSILALETFLNSEEINALLGSFLGGKVPSSLITPLAFCAVSALALLYTLLSGIARAGGSRIDDDD